MKTPKLLRLDKGVYQYYRNNVRGNQDITYDMARRKLTRNVILAKKIDGNSKKKKLYIYGCLEILVKGDLIVWIRNKKVYNNVNKGERYDELNKLLGIVDNGKRNRFIEGLRNWWSELMGLKRKMLSA